MALDLHSSSSPSTAPSHRVRVWDLPTRMFHWSLLICVLGAIVTAKLGGSWMVWHMRLGFAVLSLLLFRLCWGLMGGHWSRFARFIYSPAALFRYLRGRARPDDHFEVGHNPLGALSVFAMLGWLGLQGITGLIADDEIATTGPLVRFVSSEVSLAWTAHHKQWGQWLVFGLVALHVVAVLAHQWGKRQDLIGPMIRGDKHLDVPVQSSDDRWSRRGLALVILAVCAATVGYVVGLGA